MNSSLKIPLFQFILKGHPRDGLLCFKDYVFKTCDDCFLVAFLGDNPENVSLYGPNEVATVDMLIPTDKFKEILEDDLDDLL